MEDKSKMALGAAAVVSALLAGYLFLSGKGDEKKDEKKADKKEKVTGCFDTEDAVAALKKYYDKNMTKTHLKKLLQ
jgi:hypothetical protein